MKIGLEAAMRRSDKEITEFAEKLKVLDRCDVIRLGMVDDGKAYVVPVNFGYNVEIGRASCRERV